MALCVVAGCEPPPARLIVRAGRLIDGSGATARTSVRITVENGGIVGLEDDSAPLLAQNSNTTLVDARALTVLPGLIDAHVHALSSPACSRGMGMGLVQPSRNLQAWLRGGVTTVADLGAPTDASLSLRRYVGSGRSRGPRLLVCGATLAAVGGYPHRANATTAVDMGRVRPVRDAREARHAVMELADRGVDCINIMLQSIDFDGTRLPILDEETVCSAVDEAHNQSLRAFAHATDDAGYLRALNCDIDALVHGSGEPLSETVKDLLLAHPTPIVPTHEAFEGPVLAAKDQIPTDSASITPAIAQDLQAYAAANAAGGPRLPSSPIPNVSRPAALANISVRQANTAWLVQAKMPLAFGSDAPFCFNWPGDPVPELAHLVRAGMTPLQALHTAAQGSARVLNLQDALGLIRIGYRGDMIAVEGRPDEALEDLRAVRHVIIDGVVQNLDRRWYAPLFWGVEMLLAWLTE